MNGLAFAEDYFEMVGRPMLDTHFPGLESRIAAGLVGMGSECLGFDDQISRDHDWGPGFCLWLEKGDYESVGLALQQCYKALPSSYKGIQRRKSSFGHGRLGVHEIGGFYRSFIGLSRAPKEAMQWLVIPEYNLAALAGGKVFFDSGGGFSGIRDKIIDYYPEDVRLKKMAGRCMSAAQSGQYNYLRCLMRDDLYAAKCTLVGFCEDILAMVFLLNRRYMPYYKWHCRAAANLPLLGRQISQAVSMLCRGNGVNDKFNIITECCVSIVEELRQQGLSRERGCALLDHGPAIQGLIEDAQLKELDIWYRGG